MARFLNLHGVVDRHTPLNTAAPPHRFIALPWCAALVSDYDLDPDTAKVDPDDLAASAMTHHQILLAYCAEYPLLPLRFGTVFSGEAAVIAGLVDQSDSYANALRILSDHREYSVELVSGPPTQPLRPSAETGRGFLLARKGQRDQKRTATQNKQDFAQTLYKRAAGWTSYPLHLNDVKPENLLDISALLTSDGVRHMQDWLARNAEKAAELGLSFRVRGPWPAYHITPILKQLETA